MTPPRFAIRFDFPEGGVVYAGMHKGAAGFAPSLLTAELYDTAEIAERTLANAYGPSSRQYGRVEDVTEEEA